MIRPMELDDIPDIIRLGRDMHAESRFKTMTYDEESIVSLLFATQTGDVFCSVSVSDQLDGFIIGAKSKAWHSKEVCAGEICLYVRPARRGGLSAVRLIKSFAKWAKESGAHLIEAGVSTGLNPEGTAEIYKLAGFRYLGPLLEYGGE